MNLQDIRDYFFCSLWFYLKHHAPRLAGPEGQPAPELPAYTTLDLPGLAVRQALALHATGRHPHSFPALVELVWQAWFADHGLGDDVLQAARGYADFRNGVLAQFADGRIRKPGGQMYIEPRMSARYAEMMENAGLTAIAARIEEAGREKLGAAEAELAGTGPYSLADAYADSLWMAGRYSPPLPEAIHGLDVPVQIRLDNGEIITGTADLIIAGAETTTIEVHDCRPAFALQRSWANRRLDVLAALQMAAADGAAPFPPVGQVIYRHFMSGKTILRKRVRTARLSFAFEAARRGIQAGVFVPQFLSGDLSRCRACPAQHICITPNGDILEWFQPGEAGLARKVQDAARRLGRLDGETVRRLVALDGSLPLREILAAIETSEK